MLSGRKMFELDYCLSYPWEINKDTSKVVMDKGGMYVREKVCEYVECAVYGV